MTEYLMSNYSDIHKKNIEDLYAQLFFKFPLTISYEKPFIRFLTFLTKRKK